MEQNKEIGNYIDKKIFIFSIFLLFVLIISTVILCYFLLSNQIVEILNERLVVDTPVLDDKVEETVTQPTNTKVYCLKEYNGKIGVYADETLVYTLDTYVFTLPEIDKQLLSKGIFVSDKSELIKIIEGYN